MQSKSAARWLPFFTPPRVTRRSWTSSSSWVPPFDDAQLARVAYHEAGHAVVAQLTGANPYLATITPSDGLNGRVQIHRWPAPPEYRVHAAFKEIAVCLAGPVVDHLWFDHTHPSDVIGDLVVGQVDDATDDFSKALRAALALFGDEERAEQFCAEACTFAWVTLNLRAARLALGRLAYLLKQHATIDREQIQGAIPFVRFQLPEARLAQWASLAKQAA